MSFRHRVLNRYLEKVAPLDKDRLALALRQSMTEAELDKRSNLP